MTLGAMFTTLYSTSALAVLPTTAVTESTDTAAAQSTEAQNIESQSIETQGTESQIIKKQNLDTSAAKPDTDSSIATTADSTTTVDVTTNQGITPISAPQIKPNSARTRPNFTPNQQQQASLDKLKTFYPVSYTHLTLPTKA